MKTKRVKLENLVPDNLNANRGTARGAGMVEHSIRNYGAGRSILVDAQNRIIAGNKTHAASLEAGLQDAVVIETDGTQLVVVRRSDVSLDSPEGRALAIADNRAAEVGLDWDLDALAEISEDLDLSQFWFEGEIDIPDLSLDGPGAEDGLTDPDEVPEVEGEPITKRGDVWILGDHRVMCGDSTSAEDVARLMGGERVDLCFTSPPYNSGDYGFKTDYSGKVKKFYKHGRDKRTEDEWVKFCDQVLILTSSILKDDDSVVVWNVMYTARCRSGYGRTMFAGSHGLTVKETICWDKGSGFPTASKGILSRDWELIFVLSKGEKYRTTQQENEPRWASWKISRPKKQHEQHKATFPVELPERAIKDFGGQTIFDPFLGSGTTLIAAEQLGRQCFGMEIDSTYCDVIVKRWEEFTGKKAELESADK